MNKNFFIVLTAMACFALGTFAQSSNDSSSTNMDISNWNTVFIEWNPSKIVYTGNETIDDFDGGFNGLSLGYTRAISLSTSIPLFVEMGLAGQFSFKKDDKSYYNRYDEYYENTTKLSMVSFKIPLNIMYKIPLPNSSISFIPFAGATLRGNIWGEQKKEWGYEDEIKNKKSNLFDKKDMEGNNNTWKRIQIGWQIGLKTHFSEKFIISGSYGTDFSEIVKKYKFHTGSISVGYTF